jgi:hypothetical protein
MAPSSGMSSQKCAGSTRCTSRSSSAAYARSALDDAGSGSDGDWDGTDDASNIGDGTVPMRARARRIRRPKGEAKTRAASPPSSPSVIASDEASSPRMAVSKSRVHVRQPSICLTETKLVSRAGKTNTRSVEMRTNTACSAVVRPIRMRTAKPDDAHRFAHGARERLDRRRRKPRDDGRCQRGAAQSAHTRHRHDDKRQHGTEHERRDQRSGGKIK